MSPNISEKLVYSEMNLGSPNSLLSSFLTFTLLVSSET